MRNSLLKKQLKSAFDAPLPERKEQFLSQLDYPRASRLDFARSQAGYIRKRVWILSFILFIGTFLGLYVTKTPASFIWIVSSVLPFISLVSIGEIARSATYKMDELEMSCKYNLLEVTIIRLGILGVTNLAVIIGILLLFIGRTNFGLIRLGLYLFTPYLLTCYGTIFAINRLKSRDTMYVCAGVTVFVSMLNTLLRMQISENYTGRYGLFWAMSLVILVLLSVKEIVKLIKKMEELQWNSSLTA